MISFKSRLYQQDIILQCVRWHVAYSLSYRDLEEHIQELGYALEMPRQLALVVESINE